jgi:hypothetical protein
MKTKSRGVGSRIRAAWNTLKEKAIYYRAKYGRSIPEERPTRRGLKSPREADICFIYNPERMHEGTTILRCLQLHEIVKSAPELGKRRAILTDSIDQRDSILFLTKNTILGISREQFRRLRSQNNIILADYVDGEIDETMLDMFDVLVASSYTQYHLYRHLFPKQQVEYLTHCVDTRLEAFEKPKVDTLRIVYNGQIENTVFDDEMLKHVDFKFYKPTVDQVGWSNDAWIEHLAGYSCHYCVRRRGYLAGKSRLVTKPLTKVFTAAHCHANAIIQRYEDDVIEYMGYDYPYLLLGTGKSEIMEMLRFIRESYMQREWLFGLEIMDDIKNRCGSRFVRQNFFRIVDSL